MRNRLNSLVRTIPIVLRILCCIFTLVLEEGRQGAELLLEEEFFSPDGVNIFHEIILGVVVVSLCHTC